MEDWRKNLKIQMYINANFILCKKKGSCFILYVFTNKAIVNFHAHASRYKINNYSVKSALFLYSLLVF